MFEVTRPVSIFFLLLLFFPLHIFSQDWEFVKEKNGIRIYSGEKEGSKIKAFRAEADIKTTLVKISPVLSDPYQGDWWAEDVTYVDVIDYKVDEYSKYYLVYNVPWPLTDRDLYVESDIISDINNNIVTVTTNSVDGVIPEKPDLVRIRKYWQQWTAVKKDESTVHLILEGYTDPGGNVPAWLQNMFTHDTPVKLFENLREKLE